MSSIMYRRELHVAETAEDMGKLFAESASDIQVSFLLGAAKASRIFPWSMQCRHIVDELGDEQRSMLLAWLTPLFEHVEEIAVEREKRTGVCRTCGRVRSGP